ncbi:unnamed protein product [Pseudo-nitzschia multistriata]|uniref:Uncharacterized protein n=1 Tax=Pseudo-nitzschia multistriata TaxID=183589 RepID=A0A448ZE90_9STRA|nr:unnamed protein product [Pseudo-nitzschia multistriata]
MAGYRCARDSYAIRGAARSGAARCDPFSLVEPDEPRDAEHLLHLPRNAHAREFLREEADRQKEHGEPAVQELRVADPPGGLVVLDLLLLADLAVLFLEGVQGRHLLREGDLVQNDLSGNVLRDPVVVPAELCVPVKVALDLGELGARGSFLGRGGLPLEAGLREALRGRRCGLGGRSDKGLRGKEAAGEQGDGCASGLHGGGLGNKVTGVGG